MFGRGNFGQNGFFNNRGGGRPNGFQNNNQMFRRQNPGRGAPTNGNTDTRDLVDFLWAEKYEAYEQKLKDEKAKEEKERREFLQKETEERKKCTEEFKAHMEEQSKRNNEAILALKDAAKQPKSASVAPGDASADDVTPNKGTGNKGKNKKGKKGKKQDSDDDDDDDESEPANASNWRQKLKRKKGKTARPQRVRAPIEPSEWTEWEAGNETLKLVAKTFKCKLPANKFSGTGIEELTDEVAGECDKAFAKKAYVKLVGEDPPARWSKADIVCACVAEMNQE